MGAIHIPEAELARDLHKLLSEARSGTEIIIENGELPSVVMRLAMPRARTAREILARMHHDPTAVMDEEFARDIQAGIDSQVPAEPSLWD